MIDTCHTYGADVSLILHGSCIDVHTIHTLISSSALTCGDHVHKIF